MGIFGMQTYLSRRLASRGKESSAQQEPRSPPPLPVVEVDLKLEAERILEARGVQPVLLCDTLALIKSIECNVLDATISRGLQSKYCRFYGSHLRTVSNAVSVFVCSLRHLGIEPVFVTDGVRSKPDESVTEALSPQLLAKKRYTDIDRCKARLKSNDDWQKVCDGYLSSSTAKPILHSLCAIVCTNILIKDGITVIECNGEADDTLIKLCQSSPEVLGILSGDTDFTAAEGCRFFPIIFFDMRNNMGFQHGTMISRPESLVCYYSTAQLIASSLEIREDQVSDLAILCGNDYTRHLNAHYRVAYHLGIKQHERGSLSVSDVARYLKELDGSLLEHLKENHRNILHDEYCSVIEYSCDLYAGNMGDIAEIPKESKMARFSYLDSVLKVIQNKGTFYRLFFVENMSVAHVPAFDVTLPLRRILYYVLECNAVVEEGRNASKLYGGTKVHVPNLSINAEWLTSDSLDNTAKMLCLYFLMANPNCALTQGDHLSGNTLAAAHFLSSCQNADTMSPHNILHGVLVCTILSFISNRSNCIERDLFEPVHDEELKAMLVTFVLVAAEGPPLNGSFKKPKIRAVSLSALVWSTTLSVYLFAQVLGLTELLPSFECFFDTSTFVPLYEVSRYTDKTEPPRALKIISNVLHSVSSTADFEECFHYFKDTSCLLPFELVKFISLFSRTVSAVKLEVIPCLSEAIEAEIGEMSQKSKSKEDMSTYAITTDEQETEPGINIISEEYVGSAELSMPVRAAKLQNKKKSVYKTAPKGTQELPIMKHKKAILEAVSAHEVSVIDGQTGSGKSTRVPQFLYEYEKQYQRLDDCSIVITQPRRLAAKSLAERVANEIGDTERTVVGYRIGGEQSQERFTTKITYVTAGYLLKYLTSNFPESITKFSHLIMDEVHERSAEADFLCLVVRSALKQCKGRRTKLVLMSATLEGKLYSSYFKLKGLDVAEPIFIEGRQFAVDHVFIDQLQNPQCPVFQHVQASRVNLESNRRKAKLDLMKDCKKFLESSGPNVQLKPNDVRLTIACNLILSTSNLGEGILVFLPGLADMMLFYDHLQSCILTLNVEEFFKVFVLHSQVPMSEQKDANCPPPEDVAHIIIATSVAESSVTIPKLRLVINFCLRKEVKHDTKRNLSILTLQWCSQASCNQRGGRAGRVFSGVAVHLITKKHYEQKLPSYDDPEMVKTSLSRLLLQAKVLCDCLSFKRPSFLLKETLSPPNCMQLSDAVHNLYSSGAITKECEKSSEITLLGHFHLSMPVDMHLSKLVLLGFCFGYPAEAIIMAAGLSLRHDVFSTPLRLLLKDFKYRESLWRSVESRWHYDKGQFSEPITYLNLFKEWYMFRKEYCQSIGSTAREYIARKFVSKSSNNTGVNASRLLEFEAAISNIASKANHLVPSKSKLFDIISTLARETRQSRRTFTSDEKALLPLTTDNTMLKCLIVAAFSQNILQGVRNYQDATSYGAKDEDIIKIATAEGIDVTSCTTMIMEPMAKSENVSRDKDTEKDSKSLCIDDLARGASFISGCNEYPWTTQPRAMYIGRGKQIAVVDFADCKPFGSSNYPGFAKVGSSVVKTEDGLTSHSILFALYGLRSKSWAVKVLQNLPKPRHPCSVAWYQVPDEVRGSRSFVIAGDKRNPVNSLCDTVSDTPFLGAAASLMGAGNSILGTGMTVLPRIDSFHLTRSLLMVLCFFNFQNKIKILKNKLSEGKDQFSTFVVNGESFDYSKHEGVFITVDDIARMNAIRTTLSDVMSTCKKQLPLTKMEDISRLVNWLMYRKMEVVIHDSPCDEVKASNSSSPSLGDSNEVASTEDSTAQASATDSTVQASATDSTVQATKMDSTVQASATDSTVQASKMDSTVQASKMDSTVEASAVDSTVQASATDSTVQASKMDSTVEASKMGSTVQASATDSTVQASKMDSTAQASAVDSTVQASKMDSTVEASKMGSTVEASATDSTVQASKMDSTAQASATDSTVQASKMDSTVEASKMGSTVQASATDSTVHASKMDSTVQASKMDSTVQASVVDSTVQASKMGSTVQASKMGSTVQASKMDSTVQASKMDSTVQASATDSTVQASAVDSTVQASKMDSTVQASKENPIAQLHKDHSVVQTFQESLSQIDSTIFVSPKSESDTQNWVSISETVLLANYTLYPQYGIGTMFPTNATVEIRTPVVESTLGPRMSLRPTRQRNQLSGPTTTDQGHSEAARRIRNITGGRVADSRQSLFSTRTGYSIDLQEESHSFLFGTTVSPEASSDESGRDDELGIGFEQIEVMSNVPLWSQRLVQAIAHLCLQSHKCTISVNKLLNRLLASVKKKTLMEFLKILPRVFSLQKQKGKHKGDLVHFKSCALSMKPEEKQSMALWMKKHGYRLRSQTVQEYSEKFSSHDRQSGFRDVRPLVHRQDTTHANHYALLMS